MAAFRILAIAVASGRAGYVFIDGGKLYDWGTSVKAVKNTTEIAGFVQSKINACKPTVVVTEKCDGQCRKGKRARKLIASVAEIASHNYVLDVSVARSRRFPSKYDEATHLVHNYPELAGHLPKQKRRSFDFEPRSMITFEALALAEGVLKGPTSALAAAMG